MKSFSYLLLLTALVAVSVGACTPAVEPVPIPGVEAGTSGSWEYTFLTVRRANEQYVNHRLNELGQDGWECYFVDKNVNGIQYMLKRPKQE